MAGKLILFQWTGWTPRVPGGGRGTQTSCAGAFPTKAAFMRATNTPRSAMPWVSVDPEAVGRPTGNTGATLALANPGVVYYRDTVNHTHNQDVWLVHPKPEES